MDNKTTNNHDSGSKEGGGTTVAAAAGVDKRHQEENDGAESRGGGPGSHRSGGGDGSGGDKAEEAMNKCRAIWEEFETGKLTKREFSDQTSSVLLSFVQTEFMQPLKQKCIELNQVQIQIKSLREELQAKSRENDQLNESNKKKTESMQSLIKAFGTSTEQSRTDSQAKLKEAHYRAELTQVKAECHEKAVALSEELRKNHGLQEDNKTIKAKYQKEQAEKVSIERDYRTLKSTVARFRGGGTSSGSSNNDAEYYKQKYENEKLTSRSQKSLLEDKDREIANLKRDRDRHLSQNVLASIRAANKGGGLSSTTDNTTTAGSGGGPSLKKGRYSY